MKFKPCCHNRCLLGNCAIAKAGGCYCVCRLHDALESAKSHQAGNIFGSIYVPPEFVKQYWDNLSEVEKQEEIDYRENKLPKLIENIQNEIKRYEIE